MSITNWGELTKALDDNETIEEAIARLIAVHDDDPDAHLGENGSLLSHKGSEIIDHLARSIVADKIEEWISVKLKGSFDRDDLHWYTIFESIDGYEYDDIEYAYVTDGGAILLTNTSANMYSYIAKQFRREPALTWAMPRRVKCTVYESYTGDQKFYLGLGYDPGILSSFTFRHIGWKVINSTLYATVANGTTESVIDCGTMPYRLNTTFEFNYDGVSVEFFVNGESVGTISTNIPTGSSGAEEVFFANLVITGGASYKKWSIRDWDIWIDYNA
jgi:hypothetical protein